MTRAEIMNGLTEIFKDVFEDDSLVLTEETNANDIDDWDSLMHITILQAVQGEFNVEFGIDEITSMKNVGEMIDLVESKLK